MSEQLKKGVGYVTVGGLCAILGAMLSLRLYAGLPERVQRTENRLDINDARWTVTDAWSRDMVIELKTDIADMKAGVSEMRAILQRIEKRP